MIAAENHALPLTGLAAGLGAEPGHAADFAVGSHRVRLLSSDPAVIGYATTALRPAHVPSDSGTGGRPPGAVCLAVPLAPCRLDRLTVPGGEPAEHLHLHGGRRGLAARLGDADGFRLVRMPGRADRFVTDTAARSVLYAGQCDDPRSLTEPAALTAALLTALAAQDGPVLAGAAVGTAAGAALLLDTGEGTATATVPLLHGYGHALLSWSSVQLTRDPGAPGGLRLRGLPSSCELPVSLLRRVRSLARHVCLADHPELAAPRTASDDLRGTVEFTQDELAEALGCRVLEQAPLALLVGPSGVGPETALRRAAGVSAARFPAWHGIGATPRAPAGTALAEETGAHPWIAVDGYDAVAARTVAGELERRHLTGTVPDRPDATRWPRSALTGRWVAVMEHRRLSRGMKLERWRTRAVPAGTVHELMTTPAPPPAGGDRVDEVSYLGFAEFTGGLLAVGDAVHEADGKLLGHVLGFDDTHLPNHMNVVLLSEDRRTGRQRGLVPGGRLHVTAPADARSATGPGALTVPAEEPR
ncbi:DUF6917 domain-containing protein [Streptomyces sp. NPDC088915]|uniref:DUF6917 domain-containing protein n=1 Tax=Streptomyces sp. NPDC088915 TaxID=3365912 RepID=UPI00380CCE6D